MQGDSMEALPCIWTSLDEPLSCLSSLSTPLSSTTTYLSSKVQVQRSFVSLKMTKRLSFIFFSVTLTFALGKKRRDFSFM